MKMVVGSTKWFKCWHLGNYFPLVYTIQVRLVVKMKGRNEKRTVSHEKPYNLQVP